MADRTLAGPAPAVDPELAPALAAMRSLVPGGMPSVGADNLAAIRAGFPRITETPEQHFGRSGRFRVEQLTVPGTERGTGIPLLVCSPASARPRGCIVYLHGGGMVLGNHYNGVDEMLDYAAELDLCVVSVDYRLAPEHPYPAPVEDCWSGLSWAASADHDLGFPRERIVLAGESAGGGLAAGTALLARDRTTPHVHAQMLLSPMLDHRSETRSMRLLGDAGMWDRDSNVFGWTAFLGAVDADRLRSGYASPSRAADLAGLPATFIDVGGADAFRDEAVGFASDLSAAGNLVDLHLWAGAYHGFDGMVPHARVSREARLTRRSWLGRLLA